MRLLFLFIAFVPMTVLAQQADITKTLDNWHKAAADAKFDAYFNAMATDAVYIGTDATEHWNLEEFKAFSKPYFDKGKAWSFTAVERHIYLSSDGKMAWFDELLDTQMKICRGSGVLRIEKDGWKIVHYVLSMAIPNEDSNAVVKIKTPFDDALTTKLKQNTEKK